MRSFLLVVLFGGLFAVSCAGHFHVESRPQQPPVEVAKERPSHPAHLGIPPGHLPPPGQCRVWVPGRPPGHQSPSGSCSALRSRVPAGAWLVFRPSQDRKHVEVSVFDLDRPSVVVSVGIYEARSGRLVR